MASPVTLVRPDHHIAWTSEKVDAANADEALDGALAGFSAGEKVSDLKYQI